MDERPKEGIIGFFDILGYQSFLQNNSAEYAAKEVFSTLTNLDKKIPELLSESFQTEKGKIPRWVSSIEWLIFSDTILLTSSLNDEGRNEIPAWMGFIMASLMLNSHMFKFGLPLRGAITIGKYFVQMGCFAGEPIIEAYKLTQDIDLAACIITEKAYENISFLVSKMGTRRAKFCLRSSNFLLLSIPSHAKVGRKENYTR